MCYYEKYGMIMGTLLAFKDCMDVGASIVQKRGAYKGFGINEAGRLMKY